MVNHLKIKQRRVHRQRSFRMELFQSLKSYLRRLGILPWSSNPRAKIFVSLWNCFLFGLYVCYFLAPLCYVLSTAQTFDNYTKMSIYLLSSLLLTLWYSVCVWQKAEYQALFLELENVMERSTYYFIFIAIESLNLRHNIDELLIFFTK